MFMNGHIILIALILTISEYNYTVFDMLEIVMSLLFFFLSEMIFKWPYVMKQWNLIFIFFKMY